MKHGLYIYNSKLILNYYEMVYQCSIKLYR